MAAKRGRGGARPGSGRKPKPPHEKQRNRLIVLLTDDEMQEIKRVAGHEPLGSFARRALLRLVKRRK